ncbi:MAG: hypothetical protein AB1601_16770 [Planctomycetota bacterium]
MDSIYWLHSARQFVADDQEQRADTSALERFRASDWTAQDWAALFHSVSPTLFERWAESDHNRRYIRKLLMDFPPEVRAGIMPETYRKMLWRRKPRSKGR